HRGEGPTTELTPHAVPVRVGRILPGADHVARAGREQLVALDAHVHLERLAGEVGEGRGRALPAERLHHQVGVDAADAGRIDLALRRRAQHAEVDALGGEACFATGTGVRGLPHEVGALPLQVATHLVRQRL